MLYMYIYDPDVFWSVSVRFSACVFVIKQIGKTDL